MISIYSKRYRAIENTKSLLSDALYNTKYHLSNVVDTIRYTHDETWLAIVLVSTWVFCAVFATWSY
jgi:hypothetical protein